MFGDNDTNEEDEPTEFVMKKGERGVVHIWAVVDGEQVFSAAPHITAVGKTVSAAVESWMSRAYRDQIDELRDLGNNDDSHGFL